MRNRPRGRCPICQNPSAAAYRPFCSKRCADIDLNRWLKGSYAIGSGDAEDSAGSQDTGAPDSSPETGTLGH